MVEDKSLTSRLDNSSIQIYPQPPHKVALDSVQDMSTVFQELYDQHKRNPRSFQRLASKPRTNFFRLHNFGKRRGDEGEEMEISAEEDPAGEDLPAEEDLSEEEEE